MHVAVRRVLPGLRRRLDAHHLVADTCPAVADEAHGNSRFHLRPHLPLTAGWYMLEVVHTTLTIGADLEIRTSAGVASHLQLRGRPLVKRIVHLPASSGDVSLTLSLPNARLERFTLVPVAAGFARKRMVARLASRGVVSVREIDAARQVQNASSRNVGTAPQVQNTSAYAAGGCSSDDFATGGQNTLQALYATYQAHLHRHVAKYGTGAGTVTELNCPALWNLPPSTSTIPSEAAAGPVACRHSQFIGENALCRHLQIVCEDAVTLKRAEPALDALRRHGIDVGVLSGSVGVEQRPAAQTFVAWLAPGTLLQADALLVLISELRDGTVLCHGDHDSLDASGTRHSPCFTPQWNPDLLLGAAYIKGFFACRFDWLVDAFECRGGHWPSATTVLATAAAVLSSTEVQRVPVIVGSLSSETVGCPVDASAQPHRDHESSWHSTIAEVLKEHHPEAEVLQGRSTQSARVIWPLPEALPSVDIIIPTRDRAALLQCCVDSVLELTSYPGLRIVIVDNDSREQATHRYFQHLEAEPKVGVIRVPGPFNYAQFNNLAVQRSSAEIVVLLNNDTEVFEPGWLEEMVRQASRAEIGCVGAKLHYSNGLIQHAGVFVGVAGVAAHGHRYHDGAARGYMNRLTLVQNVSSVTGACLAVRRSLWQSVGGMDARNLPVSYNDVDLCLRVAAAGYRNLWTPHAALYHHESVSRGANQSRQSRRLARREAHYMKHRWHTDTFDDPAYHPRLTHEHEDFGF